MTRLTTAWSLAAAAVIASVGCGADDASSGATGGALGAECDPFAPCESPLLCLDGRCVARPAPPDVARDTEPPPLAHVDIVAPDPDADASDADAASDDASDDASDVLDDGGDADAEIVGETELVLAPHEALENPSDTKLGLAPGQAAVRQVEVPEAASMAAIEAIAGAPGGAAQIACGLYAPALWLPEVGGDFAIMPTWRGAAQPVRASDEPLRLAVEGDRPAIAPGPVRFGLVYEGPCPEATFGPWLVLDASGDPSDSFVWASAWIPGATLPLSGHWGLSLVVAVAGLR